MAVGVVALVSAMMLVSAAVVVALVVPPRAHPDAGAVAGKVTRSALRDAAVTSHAPWPVPLDRRTIEASASPLPPQPPTVIVDPVFVEEAEVRVTPQSPPASSPPPQRVVRRAAASPYADPHAAYGQVGPGSISR